MQTQVVSNPLDNSSRVKYGFGILLYLPKLIPVLFVSDFDVLLLHKLSFLSLTYSLELITCIIFKATSGHGDCALAYSLALTPMRALSSGCWAR